jgi:quercetin dioxygenase-like cupin family protein
MGIAPAVKTAAPPNAGAPSMTMHKVIPADQRPAALNVFGTDVTVLAAASEVGGYGITHQQGAEGSGPPPHSHGWDEAFFVLTGEITFRCADEVHVCRPGTLVHVPRGTVHAFTYGAGGGSMLEFTSRDNRAAEMFTEVDAEIDRATPDIAKALEVLRRNGVTVVG